MTTSTMPAPQTTAAAKEWDEVRTAFASSIMVDTALSSLAQNLDGLGWPLAGGDETPAGYIDLSFDEVQQILRARGQPDGAELLTRILRETLAFDEPFGEMVKQTEESARRDNPLLRTLGRLNVSEHFPLTLVSLDEDARELCRREHLETIGQFALFAQNLSQSVIVGGDFRRLLNALAHVDEHTLAEFLPFRIGSTGLHLAQALAKAADSSSPADQTARTLIWFGKEFEQWREVAAADPQHISRMLSRLHDPELQRTILALLAPHLPDPRASRQGWSRISAWFKR